MYKRQGGDEAEAARADVSGDAGDHGFGHLGDLPEEADQGVRVGRVAQVGARAEGVPGVGEDDGAHAGVLTRLGEGGGEVPDEGGGEGVAVVGGVEGEGLDAPRARAGDVGGRGHCCSLSARRRILPEVARGTVSTKVTLRTRL